MVRATLHIPAMIPAICPAALFAVGFCAALLGPAASAAAGLGALLARAGSCFASRHFTALHLSNATNTCNQAG